MWHPGRYMNILRKFNFGFLSTWKYAILHLYFTRIFVYENSSFHWESIWNNFLKIELPELCRWRENQSYWSSRPKVFC